MRQALLSTLLLLGLSSVAFATHFITGTIESSGLASSNGTDLPYGDLVLFGTFSPGFNIQANASDLVALEGAFTEVGSSYIGQGAPAGGAEPDSINAGLFIGTASDINTTSSGLNVAGDQLYYWVFNASTANAATEQGIFSSSLPAWTIASGLGSADPVALGDTTESNTDLADLTVGDTGQNLDLSAVIAVGSFGNGINGATGASDFDLVSIAAVPEPSSTALVGGLLVLGLAVLCRSRLRTA